LKVAPVHIAIGAPSCPLGCATAVAAFTLMLGANPSWCTGLLSTPTPDAFVGFAKFTDAKKLAIARE